MNRRLAILEVLTEGRWPAWRIAKRVGCCVLTVYREIRALVAEGYQIGAVSGCRGGFWLMPDSKPAPVKLTAHALRKIMLLVASSTAGADLIEPLMRAMPPAEAIKARRILGRLQVERAPADITAVPDAHLHAVWDGMGLWKSVKFDDQELAPHHFQLTAEGPSVVGRDRRHQVHQRSLLQHERVRVLGRRFGWGLGEQKWPPRQWALDKRRLRFVSSPHLRRLLPMRLGWFPPSW